MKRKKILCAIMTALVSLSMISGCGSKGSGDNNGTTAVSSNATEAGTFPLSKDKITLKILAAKSATEVSYSDMDCFKEYEKKTNVHIEWDNPPAENFTERYNLVMASGELPDMIVGVPGGDIMKYGQMGALVPLNDLIDKNAPNIKALMAKYPDVKKVLTQSDGKIYNLARLNPFTDDTEKSARMNSPLMVRQDWLKKLNLKEPVTTDDWYNVWKAFKAQDPNGNGKADEIPFGGNSIDTARSLVRGWGVDDGFYLAKDKKEIHYGPIEDKYKEAITWIAKCYSEGLIDKEIATNDEKAFQAKVAQNLVGSERGLLGGHLRTFNETMPKTIPDFQLVGAAPLKGPYGDQREPIGGIDGGSYVVITKADKHPDISLRWIDYFFGEEGSMFISFGTTEGKTYTKSSDGHYHYSDYVQKNSEGKSAKQVIGTFSPVQNVWPNLFNLDTHLEMNPSYSVEALKKMAPYAVDSIPNLGFKQEDDETRRTVMADVKTYVDESILKFILGNTPMSAWDDYVKHVKSMGIDKVLKIYNDTYTDWQKK